MMRTSRGRFLTAGECRLKAEECRLLKLRTDNAEDQALLERIAALWLDLAAAIARRGP
jgi:hypothetical protein